MDAVMRRRFDHRSGAASGFTLLELVVSFAILSIAMLIASQLLLESLLRLSHSARRALDPAATIALKQIRADVRASSRVRALGDEWNFEPLTLKGHPAGRLRYVKVGSDLMREIYRPGGGELTSERIVMRAVNLWRWRLNPSVPALVEIELGYRETPRLGLLAGAAQRPAPIPAMRSHLVAASPRQARGRPGW